MTDTAPDVAQGPDIPQQDWSGLHWFRCAPDVLEAMAGMGIRPYRDCAEAPTLAFADEEGVHLHGLPLMVAATVNQFRCEKPGPPAVPQPPYPGCVWARLELNGYRSHTGWILEEFRFGMAMAVIYDPDGSEQACVAIGPGCRIVRVPVPVPSQQQDAPALEAGGEVRRYGDDDDITHADYCRNPDCDGECLTPF